MSIAKRIRKYFDEYEITLKHLPGQHNQKRHGWRYGNIDAVRRAMRAGVSEDFDKTTPTVERDAYRLSAAKRGNYPKGWVGKLNRKPKQDDFNIVDLPSYYKNTEDLMNNRDFSSKFQEDILKKFPRKEPQLIIEQLERDAKQYLSESKMVKRATPDAAIAILESGRFKTQFETGNSDGCYDPEYRSTAENNGLGVPGYIPDNKRPVYGFAKGAKGPAAAPEATYYGSVQFVFKDSVRRRTTFTFGDSLNGFSNGEQAGTPVNAPKVASFWDAYDGLSIDEISGRVDRANTSYWEIQIHGGVSVKDIEKVILPDKWMSGAYEMENLLRGLEIPFEYEFVD